MLAAGCMTQHQEIDETLPPYASISDGARDPASAPTPAASEDDSGGVMGAIETAVMFPIHVLFW